MRANKRREVEEALLCELRQKEFQVECGGCGAVHLASWESCVVRNVKSWVAMSEVECECGCTLRSYMGDAVPMRMIREHLEAEDLPGVMSVIDCGPVMTFVKRALANG